MAGYLFQCRLALLRGLQLVKKKPNGHISIEKFDDVAFEDDDYAKCLIQAKHSIKPKSLDDKSVDLWKSLKVWMDQFADGVITFSSTRFILITTASASDGSAAYYLRVGATKDDRKKALMALRSAANESQNETTKAARDAFLKLSDEQAETLLAQVEVLDEHSNLADVMSEIEGELVLVAPANPELAASNLEGWWLNVIGKCLVKKSSAAIPLQHIIIKANEIGKSISGETLLIDHPSDLGVKDYSHEDEDQTFVRQMRLVGLPDQIVRRGVEDFYRASAQRSKWARENLLLDEDLSNYDAGLEDRWGRKFDAEVTVSAPDSDADKQACGQKVCLWASQQSFPLRNVVEAWITSGSFHGLSDRLRVGWHPDFQTIFKGDQGNGGS
jgi:hypothetical protein